MKTHVEAYSNYDYRFDSLLFIMFWVLTTKKYIYLQYSSFYFKITKSRSLVVNLYHNIGTSVGMIIRNTLSCIKNKDKYVLCTIMCIYCGYKC